MGVRVGVKVWDVSTGSACAGCVFSFRSHEELATFLDDSYVVTTSPGERRAFWGHRNALRHRRGSGQDAPFYFFKETHAQEHCRWRLVLKQRDLQTWPGRRLSRQRPQPWHHLSFRAHAGLRLKVGNGAGGHSFRSL